MTTPGFTVALTRSRPLLEELYRAGLIGYEPSCDRFFLDDEWVNEVDYIHVQDTLLEVTSSCVKNGEAWDRPDITWTRMLGFGGTRERMLWETDDSRFPYDGCNVQIQANPL